MNDEEKGWQVAMMADIYHHADNVLIYLGDEDDDTAALFAFLNRTHDLDNESSIDDIAERCSIGIEDLLTSYHKFTLRPWFTRIWVCQEFSAAKNCRPGSAAHLPLPLPPCREICGFCSRGARRARSYGRQTKSAIST